MANNKTTPNVLPAEEYYNDIKVEKLNYNRKKSNRSLFSYFEKKYFQLGLYTGSVVLRPNEKLMYDIFLVVLFFSVVAFLLSALGIRNYLPF